MHRLRLLGGIGLKDGEGRDVDALLRQPKHIAVLAYLAMPCPGTWHRRDSVLGTFWPEQDQSRARSALRSALYIIRGHFPEGTVRARGDDEISLAPELISTDVAAMSEDLAAGRFGEALARYEGELLPGIYVAEAAEFEKWLEHERTRVRTMAKKAASHFADSLARAGDIRGAIDAARRTAELDPDDEAAARKWIALLDRAGDRAQAFAVYERFRNHMSEAFGVRPSAETVALLDAVRTRREAAPDSGLERLRAPGLPSETTTRSSDSNAEIGIGNIDVASDAALRTSAHRSPLRRWWWLPVPIAATALVLLSLRSRPEPLPAPASRSLVVMPMENQTGDAKLAYLASGIADGIARKLNGIGGIEVRSGALSDWPDSTRDDIQAISRQFGSTVLLRSSIRALGDSFEVRAWVVDASTSAERAVSVRKFSMTGISDVESRLAADIAGAVFRAPIPTAPRNSDQRLNPESYRLTLEGWHQIFLRSPLPQGPLTARRIAADLFTKAIDIDPQNARAWSGLSTVWASQVVIDAVPYEEGFARAVAASTRALAIDSLQGTALANLAIMRAFEDKHIGAAMELIGKAERAEPSNPEVFLVKGLILRSAHLYDEARDASRIARQLDPLSPYFSSGEAGSEFCAGRPQVALDLRQADLAMNPSDHLARADVERGLALVGRYDEAIPHWRELRLAAGDTALAEALPGAKGKDGYLALKQAHGRKRLADLARRSGRISPLSIARASFAAGDIEIGFAELEKARQEGIPALYRLPCMPEFDEVRHTPRFAAVVARIGALRAR